VAKRARLSLNGDFHAASFFINIYKLPEPDGLNLVLDVILSESAAGG
jgi:hypothetical protein